MDPKSRRLSVGDALKRAAADMETNDDEAERIARRKSRVETAQLPKAPTISAEITSSWLRIFSEGKLGKKDVWNVPVTDMLAKEGQSETVDFRDASLTIDASAHVYSKRVEEVLNKTTSLAGGLASEDLESLAQAPEDDAAKLDEDEEVDAAAKEEVKTKRRRAANRGVNTLETNEASLTMKRNEREYAVDPLFHKRSAIFDSGGAKGLLLNVLSVHNGFQLVFDASDMVDDSAEPVAHAVGGEVESELRKLIQTVLPAHWQDAEICPEYAERKKGSSDALQHLLENEPDFMMDVDDRDDRDDSTHHHQPMDLSTATTDAKLTAAAHEGDDSDEELEVNFGVPLKRSSLTGDTSTTAGEPVHEWRYDGGGDDDRGDHNSGEFGDAALLEARLQRIEQREHETDNAGQPELEYYEVADGPNAEYTYFNRDKLANWSGPEHWKHKNMKAPTASKRFAQEDDEYQDEEGNIIKAASKSKGPRKQFRIDFHSPAPSNLEELLAPAGPGAILPKQTLDKQLKDARMLMIPPDINYDVANFSATFLPHHVTLAMRRRAAGEAAAEAASESMAVDFYAGGADVDDDDRHDDDNNRDWIRPEDGFAGGANAAADFSAIPVPGIALRPGDDGYLPNVAKIDKRVDVKALKQTIWKELCAKKSGDSARVGVAIPVNMATEKPFQNILEQLPLSMSEDVVREVSVPYCFVCLLHLANEKHLSIRQDNMDSLFVTQTGNAVRVQQ